MDVSLNKKINNILNRLDFLSNLYLVGGSVRDMILNRPSEDIDLATSDVPSVVRARCKTNGLRVIETGIEHGTLTVLVDDAPIEITTFRKDVATDGRHATVEFAESIETDLSRRDFTINAMALDQNGDFTDPFGGISDIKSQIIRTVGDPNQRFKEDFLRIVRAVRFANRLDFTIESETKHAMEILSSNVMDEISIERIIMELKKSFDDDKPSEFVNDLEQLGIEIHQFPVNKRLLDFAPKEFKMEAFLFNVDDLDEIGSQLRLPNEVVANTKKIRRLVEVVTQSANNPTDGDIRKFQYEAGELLGIVEKFYHLIHTNDFHPLFHSMDGEQLDPILMGRDLIDAGYEPGPKFGEALDQAHMFQLEQGCYNKNDLLKIAEQSLN